MNKLIIKIKPFNIEKLMELREILENYRIISINNELKSKDEFEIEYDTKIIELNEEFKFKVKLIQNKYYRQLLDIVDHILKIIPDSIEDDVFQKTGIVDLNDYINFNKYKNKLKMALINYMGVYNFDNIFELSKDEMFTLKEYQYNSNNSKTTKDIFEVYGMYCHNNKRIFELLESKINSDMLEKMKKCNKFILICPELINEFCETNFNDFKEYDIMDKEVLKHIIFNKVLVHEIGHGVFDYLNDSENERRANYFVSLYFNGTFDEIIKKFIKANKQGKLYENPKLISDDISTIKGKVYDI